MKNSLIAVLLAALVSSSSWGAARECGNCGCQAHCRKRCRLVCEMKEEKKAVYSSECEDFCVPGPSKRCGVKWECDECGNRTRRIVWQPGGAHVRTRAKLVKKEVTKKVPSYHWVVEDICCECGEVIGQGQVIEAAADDLVVPVSAEVEMEATRPDVAATAEEGSPFLRSLFGR